MAQVPAGFQPEGGEARCGDSFARTVTVTGEIPGRAGFGSERKHVLPRVAVIPAGDNWYSHGSQEESDLVERVEVALMRVERELEQAARDDELTDAQVDSVVYLLRLATRNLRRIPILYAYWRGDGEHPQLGGSLEVDDTTGRASEWPLEEGDDLYNYLPACRGQAGKWVDDQRLVGSSVQHVRFYFCPSPAQHEQRKRDRLAIRDLILNAAAGVRCAHWGLWRLVLYHRSLLAWGERYGGLGVAQPTAPAGPGIPLGPGDITIGRPGDDHLPGPQGPIPMVPADLPWPSTELLPPIPPADEPEAQPSRDWIKRRRRRGFGAGAPVAEPGVAPSGPNLALWGIAAVAGALLVPRLLKK